MVNIPSTPFGLMHDFIEPSIYSNSPGQKCMLLNLSISSHTKKWAGVGVGVGGRIRIFRCEKLIFSFQSVPNKK